MSFLLFELPGIKEFFNFNISHFIVQISGLLTYGQNYIGLQNFGIFELRYCRLIIAWWCYITIESKIIIIIGIKKATGKKGKRDVFFTAFFQSLFSIPGGYRPGRKHTHSKAKSDRGCVSLFFFLQETETFFLKDVDCNFLMNAKFWFSRIERASGRIKLLINRPDPHCFAHSSRTSAHGCVKWLTNNRVKTELTSECRVCWRLVGQRFGNVHKCKYGHLFMDPFCKGRLTLFPSRLFWLQSIGGPGIRASIWRRPAQAPRQDSENFRLPPRSRC